MCGKFRALSDEYEGKREAAVGALRKEEQNLKEDASRRSLVEDQMFLDSTLRQLDQVRLLGVELKQSKRTQRALRCLVKDYSDACRRDVATSFEAISKQVGTYFAILESQAEGLESPVLRLREEQDRSVTLEIKFHGKTAEHSYAYLSESQLNSFGLAVFLASVRQFNQSFKFIVLDDVINSFDIHKRPRVIELLGSEFGDYQVLLLTHDTIWQEQLTRAFPTWIHKRFYRFQYPQGPLTSDNPGRLGEIKEEVGAGRPDVAGMMLGAHIERRLQDIAQSFEVMVKYNKQNLYTLEPLLDGVRVRVQKKLGPEHPLFEAVDSLQTNSSFRNFCCHWKGPATEITAQEIETVIELWETVEDHVNCPKCGRLLEYQNDGFRCACGSFVLSKLSLVPETPSEDE